MSQPDTFSLTTADEGREFPNIIAVYVPEDCNNPAIRSFRKQNEKPCAPPQLRL